MACPPRYAGLPCHLSGVGFTAIPAPLGSAVLQLQAGHGAFFPSLANGQFFYAEVTSDCNDCCEVVRVTANLNDALTVVRTSPTCDCIKSNSRVRYVSDTRDAILAIAADLPFEVVSPLVWNCNTRTLSIDCAALQDLISSPCA